MTHAQRKMIDLPHKEQTAVEFIVARDIGADPLYQRPLDLKRVGAMAANFDADAFGIPFVHGASDGRFYVIDGQHRIAAAVQCFGEDQQIGCEVVRGITRERAAQLFNERNTSTKVGAVDRFLAGVTARDPECIAIRDIVGSVGLTVGHPSGRQRGCIAAVTALQRVYRGHMMVGKTAGSGRNPLPLKRTLVVLCDAWGDSRDTLQASLINGLGLVMLRHGDTIDTEHLIRNLKKMTGGPLRLIGMSRGLKDSIGGSLPNAIATAITNQYNLGLRRNRLPAWRTSEAEE